MTYKRGDIVLAFYPFATGRGASRRPALVVQSDRYNASIQNTIVAQITSNLARAQDPAHLLIEVSTPLGQQSGLLHDSTVSCLNLATLSDDRIDRKIGELSSTTMQAIERCLKTALAIG